MPVWLPNTTVRRGAKIEIWGGARPAAFTDQSSRLVDIQMQDGGHGPWKTITTVDAAPGTGYIDIHVDAALQRQPAPGLHLSADGIADAHTAAASQRRRDHGRQPDGQRDGHRLARS